uniref:non-specific serine/threonine protein kinase n=1 Tax=Oryza glumipatula TaxID=40148 RepID=A0A0E0B7E5_9ORYZ
MEMTKLAEMWYLNLSSNNLSGEVTPLLGKMRSLTTLDLNGNPSLCGNDIAGLNSCSSNTTTGDGHSGKTRLVLAVALLVYMVAPARQDDVADNAGSQRQPRPVRQRHCRAELLQLEHRHQRQPLRRAANVIVEKAETSASGGSSTAAAAVVQASIWSKNTTFSFGDILAATEHFNDAYCIGKGSFGTVYRADFGSGRAVAVKRLDASETGDMLLLLGAPRAMKSVVLLSKKKNREREEEEQRLTSGPMGKHVFNQSFSLRFH